MTTDALGYYALLGCRQDSDEHTLKICYRDRAKFWHPDHNPSADALENFQKISQAYNILGNAKTRFMYDLLGFVYEEKNFPDMATLKIYKSAGGEETPFLRVFKLRRIETGKFGVRIEEDQPVGTFADAERFIERITKHNWTRLMTHPWAWPRGIRVLRENYRQVNLNRTENFKMLVHNAVAYYAEDKTDKAYLSLAQALEYASPAQKENVRAYLAYLPVVSVAFPTWNYAYLKAIQLRWPKLFLKYCMFAIGLVALCVVWTWHSGVLEEKLHYYQEVRFSNGARTVDDISSAKVFNIPVDTGDTKMLYHTLAETDVMYGPNEEFDKMTRLRHRQTVRLTGYTVDREWFRIMLDNGEMGFVKKDTIKAGIGREIPEDSQIYIRPTL